MAEMGAYTYLRTMEQVSAVMSAKINHGKLHGVAFGQ
jgi:hypothetical protein